MARCCGTLSRGITKAPANFGLLIAYVVPGFCALWGASYHSATLRAWLGAAPSETATLGGFPLIVQAEVIDVMREPRLIEADQHYRGKSVEQVLVELQTEFGKAVTLACGKSCHFLGDDDRCTIYPTRPNNCVAMQAGDEQCQAARAAVGLPPLEPTSETGS